MNLNYFSSFGKLSVAPNQKWNALIRQCFHCLGVSESILTPTGNHFTVGPLGQTIDNVKIWQNVAVAISCSHKERKKVLMKLNRQSDLEKSVDCLELIPQFGQKVLDLESYMELRQYLQNVSSTNNVVETPSYQDLSFQMTVIYRPANPHITPWANWS